MRNVIEEQLLKETEAMIQHALSDGKMVPESVLDAVEALQAAGAAAEGGESAAAPVKPSMEVLGRAHQQMSKIVAPALPGTIALLHEQSKEHPALSFLGRVPLVRRMTLVALISLAAFIGLSMSDYVSGDPDNFSILSNYGWSLLVNELLLLASAALGASFFALYRANRYLERGTFDSDYEPSYWIQLTMGLMAGLMLAVVIPLGGEMDGVSTLAQEQIPQAAQTQPATPAGQGEGRGEEVKGAPESFKGLGKPLLALLGGFSAGLVYRILVQLVAAVESLVRGDVQARVATQEQILKANFTELEVQNRVRLATRLGRLQQQIDSSSNPEEIRKQLGELQNTLLNAEAEPAPPAQAGASSPPSGSASQG